MTARHEFGLANGRMTRFQREILSWMKALWHDGEQCCTALAEEAADHFDVGTYDGEIPEWLFDLALIPSEECCDGIVLS